MKNEDHAIKVLRKVLGGINGPLCDEVLLEQCYAIEKKHEFDSRHDRAISQIETLISSVVDDLHNGSSR